MPNYREPGTFGDLVADGVDMLWDAVKVERMRARLRDPATRLGLDYVLSTMGAINESRAFDRMEQIALHRPEWWLALDVDPLAPVGDVDIVLATDRSLVCVEAKTSWQGPEQLDQAARAANALAELDIDGREAIPVLCVIDDDPNPEWHRAADGTSVGYVGASFLASMVQERIHSDGPYDPDVAPQLSRQLYSAQQRRSTVSAAMVDLTHRLHGDDWICGVDIHAYGASRPIPLLIAGTGGVFVCEPEGIDRARATTAAIDAARAIANDGNGLRADVVPTVVTGSDTDPGWCTVPPDHTEAWLVPVSRLVDSVVSSGRGGLSRSDVRAIRQPAPRWSYQVTPEMEDGQRSYRTLINWDWQSQQPNIA